jgi:glycosyltransferase involved in cell wall biosynthesis
MLRTARPALSLSIVVPTHDRPERIIALLASLAATEIEGLQAVIVVDDSGSPVDLRARFPGLPLDHVVLPERVFISRAKNLGWRRATSDLIYFIDDDNVVSGETFHEPVSAMAEDPSLGAVVPAVLYRRRPDLVWVYATPLAAGGWGHTLVGRNLPRALDLEGRLMATDALPNASLVRKAAFEQIGGFSEDLVVNSSADAALRLKRAGWRVFAHTGSFIFHDVDPPGEFGYWAQHGSADPERVFYEVRDWFLLMRSIHTGERLFSIRATFHALGFLLPNGATYLLRGGARGRASCRSLLTGYLSGMRLASRQA